MNGINNKIINFLRSPLLYVLLFCTFAQTIIYNLMNRFTIYPDTSGYMDYNHNIFEKNVSQFRTPVYPYFIKLVNKIFGEENIYNSIVFMQYMIFFLSIIFFYLTIKKICKNKLLTSISTILYGASPYIFLWNNTILTESLSICSITLLAYMTISYLNKPNTFFTYFVGIYIFILIMLRPAYIYISAIYLLFWIIRYFTNKSEKRNNIVGIISMLICVILIIIYCLFVKFQYGKFEITNVSFINKVANIVRSGVYIGGDNKNITDTINDTLDGKNLDEKFWDCTIAVTNNFKRDDIAKYCSSATKNNTMQYISYILKNAIDLENRNIGIIYAKYNLEYATIITHELAFYEVCILPISFMHLYIILLISMILMFIILFKNKRIAWVLVFLLSMIIGNLFIIIVGSPGEYQRLFSSSISLVIILLTYLINVLTKSINSKKVEDIMLEIR